ncbi:hypothetical protein NE619_02180 [Anaerovorax odorimutans]|uniref:Uncharacterized protein n=1 Tax=Anaerovorax odorimutans TaxID=109327 RepID=A0ABT1RK25_9FIRM|nr:hypothetical protein [Anaerovorax odorimutans]MCQ4635524.1 hypothetical protein [Anaerovorax odorimutans]
MKKIYDIEITGTSGILSNRQNAFVIADENHLKKYDLQTAEQLKTLEIELVEGLELDTEEEFLYAFTGESIYLVDLQTFEVVKKADINLSDESDEWEIKGLYHIKDNLLFLLIRIQYEYNLAALYDMAASDMEVVCREDTENQLWFDKQNGLQIVRNERYKPKCDSNVISCKRHWFQSDKFPFKMEISVMQADKMTVQKSGVLYFVDPDGRFSLVMEDAFLKMYCVFVENNSMKVVKKLKSPRNYCPMEAYLVRECECLVLMYEKESLIFSCKDLDFKLEKVVETSFASSPPLYFQETEQLLILDAEEGKWVDMEAFH